VTDVLRDTLALVQRELLHYRRERAYWVGQVAFPLLVIGFIGYGLDEVVDLSGTTRTTYVAHLASGVLALVLASGAVGGGFTLIQDRESGFLRALLVAPVSRASLVLGKILARVVVSALLLLVLVGLLAFFTPLGLPHPGSAALALVGITTSFVALGVVLASSLRSLESFRFMAALVTVPLYLLSGIFYPVQTLPVPTRVLARMNPLTYGVDLLRHGLLGVNELPLAVSVPLLAVLSVASLAAALLAFGRRTRG
jgi:ABC-2 type transport system permease protein